MSTSHPQDGPPEHDVASDKGVLGEQYMSKKDQPNTLAEASKLLEGLSPAAGQAFFQYILDASDKNRMEIGQLMFIYAIQGAGPDGISMADLSKALDVDASFVSRNAKAFGPTSMDLPWVTMELDYDNPKSRRLKLTEHCDKVLQTGMAIWLSRAKYDVAKQLVTPVRKKGKAWGV